MLALELTFLSPLGALACLAAVLPVAALVAGPQAGESGSDRDRSTGAGPRPRAPAAARSGLLCLRARGCAAGSESGRRAARCAPTSRRSSSSTSRARCSLRPALPDATRLERARAAALSCERRSPRCASGVAGLTDRALPYLFPTLDQRVFASTLQEAATIESPPPQQVARVATSFDALAGLGSRGFFAPKVERRVCVVLTDGESAPFAAPAAGCKLVVVQFWNAAERVYRNGEAEPQYRPDDAAPANRGQARACRT